MHKNKTVEDFIDANPEWHDELVLLRKTFQTTEMTETIKWGIPTYTIDGKNVAGMGAFKAYVGIWFFQGSFLQDKHKKLINAQEGKTRGMRQWRFNSINEIEPELIQAYLQEAIANQKAGKEIKAKPKARLNTPSELQAALLANAKLQQAFSELTPGKQREYAEYIADAKRDATKLRRVEKITPMVLSGTGLNDKYKNC